MFQESNALKNRMKTTLSVTSMITPQIVELLSRITGKKLDTRDITPPVLFLAALITILLGVMLADQKVTQEEKQRWQKTLNRFIPVEGNVRQLTQLLSKGVREQKVYANKDELSTLVSPFSESEKLLLIGLGYEMAFADSAADERETRHLKIVANLLRSKPSHLEVLEAGFTHQPIPSSSALEEVRLLLAPGRFYALNTSFISAANTLLEMLPAEPTELKVTPFQAVSYTQLEKFQKSRKALDSLCSQSHKILQQCVDRGFLPTTLITDVGKISQKLKSQTFRLAILGEFSQGKSTLMNALLGEKIQPVRAIPCSGIVSVFKYGSTRRIVCHYKDGRQEEISLEQYKETAAIPKENATGEALSETLSQIEIQELVFEHPELSLCRNGVEIVDSPGLNENPNRTEVTTQLLKGTDAVIFLANAARPLTERECELIRECRDQLNGGNSKQPAHNLFVVANFMDLLEEEEDHQDVRQRFESILRGKTPLVAGENRIHYISAKAALNEVLKEQDNEYAQSFRQFTQAIEQFLISERGHLEVKQASDQLQQLIQLSVIELEKVENNLNLSEAERLQILEQVGEATGRDLKIREYADQLKDEVLRRSKDSFSTWYCQTLDSEDVKQDIEAALAVIALSKVQGWPSEEEKQFVEQVKSSNKWSNGLREKIIRNSQSWHSECSHLWNQKGLIADYTNQFASIMRQEIDRWGNKEFKGEILDPSLTRLEEKIYRELKALQHSSANLSEEIHTRFGDQLKLIIDGIDEISVTGGLWGGAASGIAMAAGLYVFTLVAIVPIVIAAVVAAFVSSFGLNLLNADSIRDKIRVEVIIKGFEEFDASLEEIDKRLDEIISSAFQTRLEVADKAIQQIIGCYENALQVNQQNCRISPDQLQANRLWLAQKQQELKQIQQEAEVLVKQQLAKY